MRGLGLCLHLADGTIEERTCTALVLEREIYTPFCEVTAVCLPEGLHPEAVKYVGVLWGEEEIFTGLADRIEQYAAGGARFLRVRSRSFGALLVQNQLEKGLHANLTLQSLLQGFFTFPHLTCQADDRTGYIYVRKETNLWDCIVHFGYKLTGAHPYAAGNEIRLTLPDHPTVRLLQRPLSYGMAYDTTRLISHFHMEDVAETPNAHQRTNTDAVGAEIVRHKYLAFDRQYLSDPDKALEFRDRFSKRGWRAKFVEYEGFGNEQLGDRITLPGFIENETLCRVRFSFSEKGWRTRLWAYEDGFYNLG